MPVWKSSGRFLRRETQRSDVDISTQVAIPSRRFAKDAEPLQGGFSSSLHAVSFVRPLVLTSGELYDIALPRVRRRHHVDFTDR